MKNILLTSTALVAFAGAAVAESHGTDGVSFAGSATLGFNDYTIPAGATAGQGDNDGFYWDANVAVTMTKALDNGLTAAATFDFDVADNDDGTALVAGGYLLSLTSETASLYFGQTDFAAQTAWASAGDMEADGFSEADGETVLRGQVGFAGVTGHMSYIIADAADVAVADTTEQLSIGATGDIGNFSFAVAYQDDTASAATVLANGDTKAEEIFAISGSTTFSGATVTVAYADNITAAKTSTGVKVSYPFGPVTATGYYVMEEVDSGADTDDNYGINVKYAANGAAVAVDYQNDQGTNKTAIDGSYELGNGLTVYAGMYQEDAKADEYYVAGSYDLGGGATLLVSYADGSDNGDDEIGANDYQNGTTVEVGFTF